MRPTSSHADTTAAAGAQQQQPPQQQQPQQQQGGDTLTAASFSPAQPPGPSTPSFSTASNSSDEYNRQTIATILPPSHRSSVVHRRQPAADTAQTWQAHHGTAASAEAPPPANPSSASLDEVAAEARSAQNDNNNNGSTERGGEVLYNSDLFAPAVTSTDPPVTSSLPQPQRQQTFSNAAGWHFQSSFDEESAEAPNIENYSGYGVPFSVPKRSVNNDNRSAATSAAAAFRNPFLELHADSTAEHGVRHTPSPLSTNASLNRDRNSNNNNNKVYRNSSSSNSSPHVAEVPTSLLRYRFGDAQLGGASLPSSMTVNRTPLDATVSAPPPEDSATRSSRVSSTQPASSTASSAKQQRDDGAHFADPETDTPFSNRWVDPMGDSAPPSVVAAASTASASHPPFFEAAMTDAAVRSAQTSNRPSSDSDGGGSADHPNDHNNPPSAPALTRADLYDSTSNNRNETVLAAAAATGGSVAAQTAVATTPHVRFSSDLDVIEAASRASTSTTTAGGSATMFNAIPLDQNHPITTAFAGGAAAAAATEAYEIDISDEVDSSLGNTTNSLRGDGGSHAYGTNDNVNAGNNSGNSNSGGRGTHGSASRYGSRFSPAREGRSTSLDTHALPLLLTPDELQLERLKAYDEASRRGSDSSSPSGAEATQPQRSADHPGSGSDGEGDGQEMTGAGDGVNSHNLNESDSGHNSRQRSPQRDLSGSAASATAPAAAPFNPNDDSDVTTLDFLRDTTNTILPDAFTSMFATTTSFFKAKTEAMVSAVPQPIRRAMTKTGEGIANAADATGMMLSNVGVYAMRGVPDRVMSPEWKYLIFVDAVNVLKCSLNVNILVAPYIFRMAGLVGGVLLILVMQIICCYYTEVYFRAKGELKGADHVIMYGDVPRITFGRWYPTFQLWYDGIALVATVAYAALNMQALLPHMKITGNAAKALSFIIPSLFCLPLAFMKRARTQPPMMTLASLLVFVSLIMMFTVFPYGSVVSATLGTIEGADSSLAILHLFPQSAQEFFVAISICVFIFTPLSRAVPVERTMQPRRYIKLLRVCVLISTVVHIAFGVCAIVSYGSKTCSVLSTSFNNHHTSVEVAVMSLLFFAFLFYIPLNMFELGELCDRRMLGWRAIPRYGEAGPNLLRILFLIGSALIAWCIPYYGLLISLSGCIGYSVVAIIIPAALDYVCRARYGLLRGRTLCFLDYVITFSGATLGGIVCVVGVVMTSYEMWLVVQSGYSTTC